MIVSEGMIGCCCEFAGAIGREEEPKFAVMTSPKAMNPKTLKKLDLIIGKYAKKK